MDQSMEYNNASQTDVVEQVDLCLEEDNQEREVNSEECTIQEEQNSNVDLENEVGDKRNEKTESREEMHTVSVTKMMDNVWQIVRDNTKAAIKCEVKGSIISRAIDIRLQEANIQREEQEAEMQELISQDNVINEHLRLELMNQIPLQSELDKTDVILNILNEQVTNNVDRYQQLERRKKELNERLESMMNDFRKYESEKQKEFDDLTTEIQETTAKKDMFFMDFDNDVKRLKQELVTAESSLQDIEEEKAEVKQRIEEIENECEIYNLSEILEERKEINKELNDLHVEDLEQRKTVEEQELKEQLDVMEQDGKNIENILADKSRCLNANRKKLEENRTANSVLLEQLDDIKQSLENYKAKHEEKQQENEKMKLIYDSKLQETFTKIKALEIKLSGVKSDITTVNEEKMNLSSKLTLLRNERDETFSSENKLKLQKGQLEHELEENRLLFVKYGEQNASFRDLDSLKATYDEIMEKYSCEVDEELQNLQEKKRHLIAKLEETEKKFSSAFDDQQKEFDVLVENTKREADELQEKSDQELHEAQLQSTAAMDSLKVARMNLKRLQQQYNVTIQKRDELGKKLNILGKSKSENTQQQQPLVGILKNMGKPEKKVVRFDPAGPSWDTLSENSSENVFNIWNDKSTGTLESQQQGATSLLDDLLRNSPPVREKPQSRNSSLFD